MGDEYRECSDKRTNSPISPCEPGVPKWPEIPGMPFSPYHMIENKHQLVKMRIYSTFLVADFGNTKKRLLKVPLLNFCITL